MSKRDADYTSIRQRFLRRHKKAELYIDFADFSFFKLEPVTASLNGGFGKAYELERKDIISQGPHLTALASVEDDAVTHMNEDHPEAIKRYVNSLTSREENGWSIASLDLEGVDLINKDNILRIEYEKPLSSETELNETELRAALANLGNK